MVGFWELYIIMALSFGILMSITVLPKISQTLQLEGLRRVVHNITFFFMSIIFMPIMSLVVLPNIDGFIEAYVGGFNGGEN